MFRLTLSTGVRVLARCEFAEAHKTTVAVTPPAPAARVRTPDPDTITFATLDTGDARMAAVLERVAKIRGRDLPLLILGQTGTGKEWLARALHQASPRADGPFVAVNCAALPDSLIEAELFGYEDGAFTGARKRGSPGKIVQADGGTLFLDEIGDMPLAQQVRLMRVLQERAVMPLGGARAVPVDVRVVCATHRDLRAMIAEGTFREDLFYRINGRGHAAGARRTHRPARARRADSRAARAQRTDAAPHRGRRARRVHAPPLARQPAPDDQRAAYGRHARRRRSGNHARPFARRFLARLRRRTGSATATPAASAGTREGTTLQSHQAAVIDAVLARHGGNVSAAARGRSRPQYRVPAPAPALTPAAGQRRPPARSGMLGALPPNRRPPLPPP